jgi:hypothetical protein
VTATVVDGVVGGTEPGTDPLRELLQQVGEGDPRLRLLAPLIQARAAAPPPTPAPRAPTVEEMEHRLARLREAYLELREQYLRVATALGACARCWGEDPLCRDCGGAGTSGFFAPDHELFLCYVVPAVRRAQAQARTTPRAPRAHQAEAQPEG